MQIRLVLTNTHSKANAEAAQLGSTGEATAKFISDARELIDYYTNIHWKKMSLQATIQDRMEDQNANTYGRNKGRTYPDDDAGELVEQLRPRGLDDRY